MRFPSKITSFDESVLSKLHIVLEPLVKRDYSVVSLYYELRKKISLKDYHDILLCLYVLDKISLNRGVLQYAKNNSI